MRKEKVVLDTNVILSNTNIFSQFKNTEILIPYVVLEEIDNHKKDRGMVGVNARGFARYINGLLSQGSIKKGVVDEFNNTIKVIEWSKKHQKVLEESGLPDIPDNRILLSAAGQTGSTLYSNDIAVLVKSNFIDQEAKRFDSESGPLKIDEIYSGVTELKVDPRYINELYSTGSVVLADQVFPPNHFVVLKSEIDEKQSGLAKYVDGKLVRINDKKNVSGIRAKNVRQAMALDALMDHNITLVSLLGSAGVGKTIIALGAALEQTIGHLNEYDKIILIKAPVPVGGMDVGALPGSLIEKTAYYNQSFLDNLEILIPQHEKSFSTFINHLMEMGKIEMVPPTFIRGRSLPRTYIIVDECQNLSHDEMKTILTRVGEGTKIVCLGDINQIDRPHLNFSNNGLTSLIEIFREQPCASHITLTKGERSSFAELAASLM